MSKGKAALHGAPAKRTVELRFGAMAPTLAKQITEQGFKFDPQKMKIFEKERACVNQLRFHSKLLSETSANTCFTKLQNVILAHLSEHN